MRLSAGKMDGTNCKNQRLAGTAIQAFGTVLVPLCHRRLAGRARTIPDSIAFTAICGTGKDSDGDRHGNICRNMEYRTFGRTTCSRRCTKHSRVDGTTQFLIYFTVPSDLLFHAEIRLFHDRCMILVFFMLNGEKEFNIDAI